MTVIYKYGAATDRNLQNLDSRTLFCRHFEDFNDPFEFWSQIVEGVPSVDEEDRLQAAFAAWGFPGSDPEEIEREIGWKEFFDSLEGLQPDFWHISARARVSCFCRESDNLLMWSHYADGLRGFCIGFDKEILTGDGQSNFVTDVEYSDTPPLVDCFVYAVAEDQFDYHAMAIDELKVAKAHGRNDSSRWEDAYEESLQEAQELMKSLWRKAFASKPKEWEYEQEVRLLVDTEEQSRAPILYPYPAGAVRQIIAGEKMSAVARGRLEHLARSFPDAEFLEARRSKNAYRLELIG